MKGAQSSVLVSICTRAPGGSALTHTGTCLWMRNNKTKKPHLKFFKRLINSVQRHHRASHQHCFFVWCVCWRGGHVCTHVQKKKKKRKTSCRSYVFSFPFFFFCYRVCVSAVSLPGNRGGTAAGCASDHIPISCLDNEYNWLEPHSDSVE